MMISPSPEQIAAFDRGDGEVVQGWRTTTEQNRVGGRRVRRGAVTVLLLSAAFAGLGFAAADRSMVMVGVIGVAVVGVMLILPSPAVWYGSSTHGITIASDRVGHWTMPWPAIEGAEVGRVYGATVQVRVRIVDCIGDVPPSWKRKLDRKGLTATATAVLLPRSVGMTPHDLVDALFSHSQ